MSSMPNLDRFWGVILKSINFDVAEMSMSLSLYWTEELTSHTATLQFVGVTRSVAMAERVYTSEIVELVSLEARRNAGKIEVIGEFSNYAFEISCVEIFVAE
jgi:hypothetical protein